MILRLEADHINFLNPEGVKGKLRTKSEKRKAESGKRLTR